MTVIHLCKYVNKVKEKNQLKVL